MSAIEPSTEPRSSGPAAHSTGATVACELCGAHYTEAEGRVCHAGCPLERGCQLLGCPNCGYETPAPSRLTRWLGRWFSKTSAAGKPDAP